MSSPKPPSPKAASSPKAPASPKAGSSSPKSPKSPKSPTSKRSASPAKEEKSPSKKAKKTVDPHKYHLNFNKAVDKEHEGKTFGEIIKLPPSAIQGLAHKADKMFDKFNVKTIEDLANWKFYQVAKAIHTLSSLEVKDGREDGSKANINKALDKEYEKKSLKEIAKAPVSALAGLAEWADEVLKPLKIKTVGDLGDFKYAKWAEAFVALAKHENSDGSS